MFDTVDLDLQFRDWLFSLEGVEVAADKKSLEEGFGNPGAGVRWYAAFRRMEFVGRGTKVISEVSRRDEERRVSHPVQNLKVSIFSYEVNIVSRSKKSRHKIVNSICSDILFIIVAKSRKGTTISHLHDQVCNYTKEF